MFAHDFGQIHYNLTINYCLKPSQNLLKPFKYLKEVISSTYQPKSFIPLYQRFSCTHYRVRCTLAIVLPHLFYMVHIYVHIQYYLTNRKKIGDNSLRKVTQCRLLQRDFLPKYLRKPQESSALHTRRQVSLAANFSLTAQ